MQLVTFGIDNDGNLINQFPVFVQPYTQQPLVLYQPRIGYEFYCEELFVVKHKTSYSCKSAIYFDLDTNVIKETCNF